MNPIYESATVCNTGPLIGLARIEMAHLPFRLFPEIFVPEEVRDELIARDSADSSQLNEVLKSARIIPRQSQADRLLLCELDAGESAVILAALQLGLPSVILDERKARRIAVHIYGLKVKGTAGLLLEAKSRGLISAVRPALAGMIQGGYFLGPNLVAACLHAAGETGEDDPSET